MRICYFGCYNPEYPRNRVIIKGLRKAGADVVECRASSLMPQTPFSLTSLSSVGFRLLPASARLKSLHDSSGRYDAMIAGFPGDWPNYLTIPFAKLLSGRRRVPLFIDQFISLYESYVHDKKMVNEHSPLSHACRTIDRVSFRVANIVFLDTQEHISLLARRLSLPEARMRRVSVGTDEDVFYPRKGDAGRAELNVLFYGSMVPLQGVNHIIRAAALLKKDRIRFKVVGPQHSQRFKEAVTLGSRLGADNIVFSDGVPYEKLPQLIAETDICLGIFGTTEKARAVIPNKAFEAIAMQKPLITGNSRAAREAFQSGVNALLCPMGSSEALADAVHDLAEDKAKRERIAEGGYRLFTENFTTKKIGLEALRHIREYLSVNPNSC